MTDPCANPECAVKDVLEGDDPGAHWRTRGSDVIAAWSCSAACSAEVEALRIDGALSVGDPEFDGYESQLDLLAATVYNVRAQSPRDMTPERWRRVKAQFRASAAECLRQAELELEDM